MAAIVELPLKVLASLWEVARNTPLPVLLLLLVGLVAIGLAFVGLVSIPQISFGWRSAARPIDVLEIILVRT